MIIDFLLDGFGKNAAREALVWRTDSFSYRWLLENVHQWQAQLEKMGLAPGSVVSLEADFSPNAIGLLLALIERRSIVVPFASSVEVKKSEFREVAEVEAVISLDNFDQSHLDMTGTVAQHPILVALKRKKHPGLVLFSSGSTGKNKAAVHDFVPLLEKFKVPRHAFRTISFLLFDHIGGINTLLYTLSNGGCVVAIQNRAPDAICEAIERHRVELLPTSPTFLNLLLLSEAYQRYDLSSLKMVTYGTEVMTDNTLRRFHELFPNLRLLQTYGLSEVGILRTQSRSSESLWVKVGGEGYQTRVVDGMLEIHAQSAMLGYLNAPSPFTPDGWFRTGDAVEVDGDYFRFLGRKSEIINVGGEKVYPAEVESVLESMPEVENALVIGESNPITGQIVTARVNLRSAESANEFRKRMQRYCRPLLPTFKIPQKIVIVNEELHGDRFKKRRLM